jgi:hypothetical protein
MKSQLERKDLKAFEPVTFKYPLLLSLGCKVSLKSPTRNIGTSKADLNMVSSFYKVRRSKTQLAA